MAAKSKVLIGLSDDDGITSENCSVSQLVSSLKSTFLASGWFSKMEETLIRREEKLNKQNEMLKEINEVERLEKMQLENEKRKLETECLNLCQTNSKLLEENKELCARQENAEERYRNVLQEMEKVGEADKSEILKLRKNNLELEMARRKTEEEIEMYKRRFVHLESMLSKVEEEFSILSKLYEASKNNVDSETVAPNDKTDSGNDDHEVVIEDCQESSDKTPEENQILEINEFENYETSRGCVGSSKECVRKKMMNLKIEKFEEDIGLTDSSRRADTWKPRDAKIVVISDSDDENSPREFIPNAENTSSISKRKRDSSPDIDAKKARSTGSSSPVGIGNFSGRRIDSSQTCSRSREDLPQMSQIFFENLLCRESSSSDSD